jgi:hypothetical protein
MIRNVSNFQFYTSMISVTNWLKNAQFLEQVAKTVAKVKKYPKPKAKFERPKYLH